MTSAPPVSQPSAPPGPACSRCPYCRGPQLVELLEVWGPREFMLDTCCQGMLDAATDFMNEDPRGAARWLNNIGLADAVRGVPGCDAGLRSVAGANGQLVLDWNLRIVPVAWGEAKDFIARHHRHWRPPAGWRFGAGVMNGPDLIAVATVGRPVSRMVDQKRIVEVNRVCVSEDTPPALTFNAVSMLYGWAAREANARGFEHAISYTLASELATTLKAASWQRGHQTKGRHWSSPSRLRGDNTPTEDKVCWYRTLVKNPVSSLPAPSAARKVLRINPAPARSGPTTGIVLLAA